VTAAPPPPPARSLLTHPSFSGLNADYALSLQCEMLQHDLYRAVALPVAVPTALI